MHTDEHEWEMIENREPMTEKKLWNEDCGMKLPGQKQHYYYDLIPMIFASSYCSEVWVLEPH
jgi:hypothetical protein